MRSNRGDHVTSPVTDGTLRIEPAASPLRGAIRVPGDKSLSHRYAMLGAIAHGRTTVAGLSPGADVAATLGCLRALGVVIDPRDDGSVGIDGRGLAALRPPAGVLDAGNSGTTLRLLAGILAGCPFPVTLSGDASLCRRPMRRVLDPLGAMGASVASADGRPPITVSGGRLRAIEWRTPVPSAQVKSAILFAALSAEGRTVVEEPAPTRDHTERALPQFGVDVDIDGLVIRLAGGQRVTAPVSPLHVPGDPSSAAVWAAAAAAVQGSTVAIDGVSLNPSRIGFLRALERMGAAVRIVVEEEMAGEPRGRLEVSHGAGRGLVVTPADVPDLIDELPVLAAAAALGGGLEVSGAGELRVKESDRITALVAGLRALGVDADERPDGFVVGGRRRPAGGVANAAGDHRLVMAFALVGLGAAGPTTITGADVVGVSYPGFARHLAALRS